jgi:23S rRNA pseudouridine2605 synthase/16S rRNA pseudouridine516 synthase
MPLERIQKILAKAGIASRREAERMMVEGRVTINGTVVNTLGFKVDPLLGHIKVDGKRITLNEPHVTLLLHKPKGYLSTVKDPKGRPTVIDLIKKMKWRIYPVGRLDFNAEGLLLLTNDGNLAYRLSHPGFSIPRTYLVKVAGIPDEKKLSQLKKGMMLEDGRVKVVSYRKIRHGRNNSWIEVVLTEGRNHLVKRMFLAIGHPVLKLKRVQFGPFQLGDLPVGQFRHLTPMEMENLKKLTAK